MQNINNILPPNNLFWYPTQPSTYPLQQYSNAPQYHNIIFLYFPFLLLPLTQMNDTMIPTLTISICVASGCSSLILARNSLEKVMNPLMGGFGLSLFIGDGMVGWQMDALVAAVLRSRDLVPFCPSHSTT